jgi:CRISPR-associated endonuclease/helicase Cas3
MSFDEFFHRATGRPPYTYQRTFAVAPRLPDLLEAPTGSGKTATAALGWLWRRRHGSADQRQEAGARLVFCLPMRTLVDQTATIVRSWRDQLGLSDTELGVHVLMGGAIDDTWTRTPSAMPSSLERKISCCLGRSCAATA